LLIRGFPPSPHDEFGFFRRDILIDNSSDLSPRLALQQQRCHCQKLSEWGGTFRDLQWLSELLTTVTKDHVKTGRRNSWGIASLGCAGYAWSNLASFVAVVKRGGNP
jgi:hypothetical protein